MPGVRAILTRRRAAGARRHGHRPRRDHPRQSDGRAGADDEPVYAGEPVLAVAAVDEETAAAAIEAIRVDFEQLPFVVDPLDSLRPDGPNPRVEGNTWGRAPAAARIAAGPAARSSR